MQESALQKVRMQPQLRPSTLRHAAPRAEKIRQPTQVAAERRCASEEKCCAPSTGRARFLPRRQMDALRAQRAMLQHRTTPPPKDAYRKKSHGVEEENTRSCKQKSALLRVRNGNERQSPLIRSAGLSAQSLPPLPEKTARMPLR